MPPQAPPGRDGEGSPELARYALCGDRTSRRNVAMPDSNFTIAFLEPRCVTDKLRNRGACNPVDTTYT